MCSFTTKTVQSQLIDFTTSKLFAKAPECLALMMGLKDDVMSIYISKVTKMLNDSI